MLDLGRVPEPGEFDRLTEVRRAAGGLNKAALLWSWRETGKSFGKSLGTHAPKMCSSIWR